MGPDYPALFSLLLAHKRKTQSRRISIHPQTLGRYQKFPKRKRQHPSKSRPVERIDISISELEEIVERSQTEPLSEQDCERLHLVLQTLHFLTCELDKKRVSVQRLKQMLFGAATETTRGVMDRIGNDEKNNNADDDQKNTTSGDTDQSAETRKKAKGHGRNGTDAYGGAQTVRCEHNSLKPGDHCPKCDKGTVYETAKPGTLIRVMGQAPLGATVYELQKLRCNLCGEIFLF